MSHHLIVDLYTDFANHPDKDFGWDKGMQNALNHGYKEAWINRIPEAIWSYCAAVGNPFSAGELHAGETVLDIGCGAGIDLCVASLLVGEEGKVLGADVTPAMVEKSRHHAGLAGLSNITVYQSSFEQLPVQDSSVDVVISNGAINLSLSKEAVFSEIYRVLKKSGNLYFCDMIKDENNHAARCCEKESWADCVAGTLKSNELIKMLTEAGFSDIHMLSTNHYKTSDSTIGATFRAVKS
jgi:SAM-dependent methyltransferase